MIEHGENCTCDDCVWPPVAVETELRTSIRWHSKSFGYEAVLGEGAFTLTVFYQHGWKVGINDRWIKNVYPDPDTCKQVAVNWTREKMKVIESQLRELEKRA